MWHSRPPRDPPPFMANTILNFHFDYLHTSLSALFTLFPLAPQWHMCIHILLYTQVIWLNGFMSLGAICPSGWWMGGTPTRTLLRAVQILEQFLEEEIYYLKWENFRSSGRGVTRSYLIPSPDNFCFILLVITLHCILSIHGSSEVKTLDTRQKWWRLL